LKPDSESLIADFWCGLGRFGEFFCAATIFYVLTQHKSHNSAKRCGDETETEE
jgi:hypothetical protein